MTAARLVVVGTSLGGFEALKTLLAGLPEDLGCAIVVVQHQGDGGLTGRVEMLQRHCQLPIREPNDKERIAPGTVYLAPAGYHLLVEGESFALSVDPPVSFARPAIDVLFESAADSYRTRVIGIALTGASADGARGLARIKRFGGTVIVQDPTTARSRVLPEAAIKSAPPDRVLGVSEIAQYLAQICRTQV